MRFNHTHIQKRWILLLLALLMLCLGSVPALASDAASKLAPVPPLNEEPPLTIHILDGQVRFFWKGAQVTGETRTIPQGLYPTVEVFLRDQKVVLWLTDTLFSSDAYPDGFEMMLYLDAQYANSMNLYVPSLDSLIVDSSMELLPNLLVRLLKDSEVQRMEVYASTVDLLVDGSLPFLGLMPTARLSYSLEPGEIFIYGTVLGASEGQEGEYDRAAQLASYVPWFAQQAAATGGGGGGGGRRATGGGDGGGTTTAGGTTVTGGTTTGGTTTGGGTATGGGPTGGTTASICPNCNMPIVNPADHAALDVKCSCSVFVCTGTLEEHAELPCGSFACVEHATQHLSHAVKSSPCDDHILYDCDGENPADHTLANCNEKGHYLCDGRTDHVPATCKLHWECVAKDKGESDAKHKPGKCGKHFLCQSTSAEGGWAAHTYDGDSTNPNMRGYYCTSCKSFDFHCNKDGHGALPCGHCKTDARTNHVLADCKLHWECVAQDKGESDAKHKKGTCGEHFLCQSTTAEGGWPAHTYNTDPKGYYCEHCKSWDFSCHQSYHQEVMPTECNETIYVCQKANAVDHEAADCHKDNHFKCDGKQHGATCVDDEAQSSCPGCKATVVPGQEGNHKQYDGCGHYKCVDSDATKHVTYAYCAHYKCAANTVPADHAPSQGNSNYDCSHTETPCQNAAYGNQGGKAHKYNKCPNVESNTLDHGKNNATYLECQDHCTIHGCDEVRP